MMLKSTLVLAFSFMLFVIGGCSQKSPTSPDPQQALQSADGNYQVQSRQIVYRLGLDQAGDEALWDNGPIVQPNVISTTPGVPFLGAGCLQTFNRFITDAPGELPHTILIRRIFNPLSPPPVREATAVTMWIKVRNNTTVEFGNHNPIFKAKYLIQCHPDPSQPTEFVNCVSKPIKTIRHSDLDKWIPVTFRFYSDNDPSSDPLTPEALSELRVLILYLEPQQTNCSGNFEVLVDEVRFKKIAW